MAKKKETGIYRMGPHPPKGMHRMPNGSMMADEDMKKMMGQPGQPPQQPPPPKKKPGNSNRGTNARTNRR